MNDDEMADVEFHLNTMSKKDKTIKSKLSKNMPKLNNMKARKGKSIKDKKKKYPSIKLSEQDR